MAPVLIYLQFQQQTTPHKPYTGSISICHWGVGCGNHHYKQTHEQKHVAFDESLVSFFQANSNCYLGKDYWFKPTYSIDPFIFQYFSLMKINSMPM